jgi:uncharacterized membrane protein
MTPYFLLKFFHVLGAIVILGTGTGIAFFMRWHIARPTWRSSPAPPRWS